MRIEKLRKKIHEVGRWNNCKTNWEGSGEKVRCRFRIKNGMRDREKIEVSYRKAVVEGGR